MASTLVICWRLATELPPNFMTIGFVAIMAAEHIQVARTSPA
jgi:hypothetical protein